MENKTKRSPLAVSLLWVTAAFATAGFGMALLTTTIQGFTANASTLSGVAGMNENISPTNTHSKNNSIILAEKPFLIEQGKTLAATQINQTHLQLSLVGNGTITLPNSTETVLTKDSGNAIARLTHTGVIVHGQFHIST